MKNYHQAGIALAFALLFAQHGAEAKPKVIHLDCSTGSGDVARPLYVRNTTHSTIPKSTPIHWKLVATSTATGIQDLDTVLAPDHTAVVNGPPGSGGSCSAWYIKK